MKVLNNKQVEERFKNSSIKPLIRKSDLKNPYKLGRISLDKKWELVIPGNPIADSRPRHVGESEGVGHFYNPHLASYLKILKKTMELADPNYENEVCILSPMVVSIKIYEKIPNTHMKYLGKEELEDLEEEKLHACSTVKDNDNIEKVNWDGNQHLNTILKDEYVVKNETEKFFIKNKDRERTELTIYYTDKPTFITPFITRIKEFGYYSISIKYKRINKIPDNKWKYTFYKNIFNFFSEYKGQKKLAPIKKVLDTYKVEELKLLGEEGTREVIINKILNNVQNIFDEINKLKKTKKKRK